MIQGKRTALAKMRQSRARLVVVLDPRRKNGRSYFIVPDGGAVSDETAQRIINRVDTRPCDEGLFPGLAQSWAMTGY